MNKTDVIKKLQGGEHFFVPFSMSTRMPYVFCDPEDFDDQIIVFARDEDLKEYIKAQAEEKNILQAIRVEKSMYTRFYGNLYGIGVNAILYRDGQEELKVELKEIAIEADFSKIPEGKRPLLNASLQLSGIYFMQALRRKVPLEEKGNLNALEEELVANIIRANFLLAVDVKEQDGEKKLNVPFVKNKEGDMYQPCFSDIMEFQKFAAGRKIGSIKVDFQRLPRLLSKQAKGYVLNPAGINLILGKEQLLKMAKLNK